MTDTDDELDVEFVPEDGGAYPDTLGIGEAFFYPDLGTFCEEHQAKAVFVGEDGGIWLYPSAGGSPVSLDKWKAPGAVSAIRRVQ